MGKTCGIYPMRRKTPCFSYGDIRRVHRIYILTCKWGLADSGVLK